MAVKNEQFIVICNGVFRLFGNIVKILSYPFHALFPKKRFTIPEYSPAKNPIKHSEQNYQNHLANELF